MNNTMPIAGLSRLTIALVFGLSLGACIKTEALDGETTNTATTPQSKHAASPHISHPKTGAAVSLSAKQAYPVAVGEAGEVEITVGESYDAGLLTLTARDTDTIDVFGANRAAQIDLAVGGEHMWRLQFSGSENGVFYIPVVANAVPQDGIAMSRAFSIRVEVGDLSDVATKPEDASTLQALPDGETAIMMPAEETIK